MQNRKPIMFLLLLLASSAVVYAIDSPPHFGEGAGDRHERKIGEPGGVVDTVLHPIKNAFEATKAALWQFWGEFTRMVKRGISKVVGFFFDILDWMCKQILPDYRSYLPDPNSTALVYVWDVVALLRPIIPWDFLIGCVVFIFGCQMIKLLFHLAAYIVSSIPRLKFW